MMNAKKLAMGAVNCTAIGSALLAGLTGWLLVTQPTSVATAVTNRDVTPLLQAVVGTLCDLFSGLLRYL